MIQRRGLGSWRLVTLVILTTLAAAATSPASQLYAAIYPDEIVVVEDKESLDDALAEAVLQWEFDAQPLTENERSRFTARAIYDAETPPVGIEVEVAFTNEASLIITAGQADLSPVTPRTRDLDEGVPWPGGGLALEWIWDVTPRAIGLLNLEFAIQPILIYDDGFSAEGRGKNEPVQIAVDVHPTRLAFGEVLASAGDGLSLEIPDPLTDGVPAEVTASLPLGGHQDIVQANITLATSEGSAPARIEKVEQNDSPGPGEPLIAKWMVTPSEGDINLVFTVDLEASAGDVELIDSVTAMESRRAGPAPPSLVDRIQEAANWVVGYIVPILAVIVALFTLWVDQRFVGLRARLVKRFRADQAKRRRVEADAAADGDS